MSKPKPLPFGPIHGNYDASLRAVLLAAGTMSMTLEMLLDMDLIANPTMRDRAAAAVKAYNIAWDGEQ